MKGWKGWCIVIEFSDRWQHQYLSIWVSMGFCNPETWKLTIRCCKLSQNSKPGNLWCTSPSYHYFCTKNIDGPTLTPFLIPFTKVMHLIERKKLSDSFAKYSKLRSYKCVCTQFGQLMQYHPKMAYVLVSDNVKLYVQQIWGYFSQPCLGIILKK